MMSQGDMGGCRCPLVLVPVLLKEILQLPVVTAGFSPQHQSSQAAGRVPPSHYLFGYSTHTRRSCSLHQPAAWLGCSLSPSQSHHSRAEASGSPAPFFLFASGGHNASCRLPISTAPHSRDRQAHPPARSVVLRSQTQPGQRRPASALHAPAERIPTHQVIDDGDPETAARRAKRATRCQALIQRKTF